MVPGPLELIGFVLMLPRNAMVWIMLRYGWERPRRWAGHIELDRHYHALGSASDRHDKWRAIRGAGQILGRLRIDHPTEDAGPEVWRSFLVLILDALEHGDLDQARGIIHTGNWSVDTGFGAPGPPDDETTSPSQRLSSTVENRTRVLVRVYAERENEEIRLSVDKRPHPQNLQWTEGGKGFRTIAKGMLGVAQLCDVRFSGGDYPTFDLRYRTPGSDWISHHLQADESGTVYRGIALVRVIVESLTFGTKVHELTFNATWFVDVHEVGAPVESMLELYENGAQEPLLWGQAYTRGFWS